MPYKWQKWKRNLLRCKLAMIGWNWTPKQKRRMKKLARKIAAANEPLRRSLENCCRWYYGPPGIR